MSTVLGAFPNTTRFDLLYGPVVFSIGAWEVKRFGLSLIAWRMMGWLGAVALTFSAAWVTKCLARSATAVAAAAALVAFSQGMGARATSGRFDTVTVALELACLACAISVHSMRTSEVSAWIYATFSGFLGGLAALSTLRAAPFAIGLAIAAFVEVVCAKREWGKLAIRMLMIGVGSCVPFGWWLAHERIGPLQWMHFVLTTTRGDHLDVSPLYGGSWHLTDGPFLPRFSGLAVVLVLCVQLAAMLVTRGGRDANKDEGWAKLRFALIATVCNYAITFLLIARFWDYEIFVVPIAIPVFVALTTEILRISPPRYVRHAVLTSWLCLAFLLLAIRTGKALVSAGAYLQAAPEPLASFVAEKIPRDSNVFGPQEFYFYAVEQAGSHYLFVRPWAVPGLLHTSSVEPDWQEQFLTGQSIYLIWPTGAPPPKELSPAQLQLKGHFTPARKTILGWSGWPGSNNGYPPTDLFRVLPPAANSGN